MPFETITLEGGELAFDPHWLAPEPADALFATLQAAIPWEVHRIRMFGREVDSPRLSCWIGDPDAHYTYSRTRFAPRPWLPALAHLREVLERATDARFNSVLANLYRDGRDSMGWHSDDEPELGAQPVIASLSLGASRRFALKARHGDERFALELPHGSLLLMRGDTQRHWRHALPRSTSVTEARINLTFRWVKPGIGVRDSGSVGAP